MEHADELLHQDPRIERTRRVVLDAALALLVERGYGEVTIEAVAAESGVAKSTIYRHWPSRLELINDAFLELKPTLPVPPEGNVRERLIVVLEHLAQDVAASRWSACLPALIDAAEHDPAARELNFRLASTGRQSLAGLLAEGVAHRRAARRPRHRADRRGTRRADHPAPLDVGGATRPNRRPTPRQPGRRWLPAGQDEARQSAPLSNEQWR